MSEQKIVCLCGHHIHADKSENWELCKCGDVNHCLSCSIEIEYRRKQYERDYNQFAKHCEGYV